MAKRIKKLVLGDQEERFSDEAERQIATALLAKYKSDYVIESIAELNTLNEIIYFEVVQIRLQTTMNELHKELKATNYDVLDILHKNSEIILKLKNSLGLAKNKDEKRGYDAFADLKDRYKIWLDSNQAARTLKCPHCQQFMLLKMRTAAWEAQKHPYFKDNLIYNKYLFDKLGKTIEIDKHFIASVLETSSDYITWVIQKVNQK